MTHPSLEARIARLEARAQIQELLVRYTLLIDEHEFDELGAVRTGGTVRPPGSAHAGRAAIVANYRPR